MEKTESQALAEEYLRLGGQRKAKIDDNITNIRKWDDENPDAARFWDEKIAVLSEDKRKQVEFFLPDINSD